MHPAIQEFINRVQRAKAANSKDFRIQMDEAIQISLELNKILLKIDKPDPLPVPEKAPAHIDGGDFGD